MFGKFSDAMSGEALDGEVITKAREVEMDTYKKHEVCEKVSLEECWRIAGRAPVGVKRVDTSKGDKEKPEHRCRLVAKEIKDKREGLFAAAMPLEAKKSLFSLFASLPR